MQIEITTIYVICDDYLKAIGYQDDTRTGMTTAEVMTTALVAPRFFKNCLEHARVFLKEHGYVPKSRMLSQSRLNRRLQAIPEHVWLGLFYLLADVHKQLNASADYVVDSVPIAVCDNYRIPRCRLYSDHREAFRGYIASKKRFFYGLRAHVVVTASGSQSMWSWPRPATPTSRPSSDCTWTCRTARRSMATRLTPTMCARTS